MSKRPKCVLNLRYTIKPGFVEPMMVELRKILDQCALEEDFVAAFLHQSPERPHDIMLYEIWHGTKEEFAQTQGSRPYRQEYMKKSKQYVERVRVEWDIPTIGAVSWEYGPPGGAAIVKGIDVGRMKDGKLVTLYVFID